MASYLSPIINNTFGLAASGQVQPELKSWQYPGLNEAADPFANTETSMTGSDISVNTSPKRSDQMEQPPSPVIRNETPVRDITTTLSEKYEHRDTRSRKVHGKQEDIKPGQEKTVHQKPEARTIISTEIKPGIPVLPLNINAVPTEPAKLYVSQNISPVEQVHPSQIGLQKDGPPDSSKKAKQVIVSNKGTFKGDKTFPDKQIKIVEPELSSPPVFHQQTKKQGVKMVSRDLLPNDQEAPFPQIRTKQETRLVIGKLTIEVVQQEKQKVIPVPPPVTVYHKPAMASYGRNSGGTTSKVKFGINQL